ncbi:MAG: hypothetical protein KKA54_17180 [Proteobacteria bacterium]|nr:hypothetical protein [Pseudomonadota bacterium]
MADKDLWTDDHTVACDRCGGNHDVSKLVLDEDEGIFLCPMCQSESISCGCGDESQVED